MNLENIIAVRIAKTIYRDGDKCIKVFDEDYSKADVLNEALNQARIEETGLNKEKIREVSEEWRRQNDANKPTVTEDDVLFL